MTNMRLAGWNILFLSFAFVASALVSKKCSTPSVFPFTRLQKKYTSKVRFNHGEKIYYDCAQDFTPSKGSRAVQCIHGKWTKLTLKCEKKSCGNAGELPNGQFLYEGNSVLGDKVHAQCNEGYTLKGMNYMICKSSGWTGEFPSCELIHCPELKIPNSSLSSTNNQISSVIIVRCNAGYQQNGPSRVVCLEDGNWSEIPECMEEMETTCSNPAVANSVKSHGDAAVYRVGDSVTFTCAQGFQLVGSQQVTCGPAGQWQPPLPQCLPAIDKTESHDRDGRCGVPVNMIESNSHLTASYITMTSFANHDRVRYECDIGYIPTGGSRYRRCVNGNWTPLLLKCKRKSCGSAGEIINGEFQYTGIDFGDTATAFCDEGYQLVGRGIRNCMNGGWDGRVPICQAVHCEDPPETNAERTSRLSESYTYRSVIHYWCHVGTLIGEREIWCTKDGTWSAPVPKCKEITCPTPNVPNASWTGGRSKTYRYQDTISFECDLEYMTVGPSIVFCGIDGQWTPSLPKCISRRKFWRT
ncbi:hypothetical protein LDENG_00084440 [Lucifuga dentata]|nr:hypothetical protein LDENG_00084440 [Lucifuga dentata]